MLISDYYIQYIYALVLLNEFYKRESHLLYVMWQYNIIVSVLITYIKHISNSYYMPCS